MAGEACALDVRMTAVGFGTSFGWLHMPARGWVSDVGFLLCAGIGQDYMTAYRSFRLLADHCAANGFPALRFDYPGTGDSGDPERRNLYAAWRSSVQDAANWLRDAAGVCRLVVLGLRLGAALAAEAAASRADVAGVVLIEPVLRGRPYLTELSSQTKSDHGDPEGDGIHLGGVRLDADSQAWIRNLDVANLPLGPQLQIAVFLRADPEAAKARLRRWRTGGSGLAVEPFDGLEAMLRPTQITGEPDLDPRPILAWAKRSIEWRLTQRAIPAGTPAPTLNLPGCTERVIRFGPGERLVGVLCAPDHPARAGFCMVTGNSGGNPKAGLARFGVELARRLGAAGIASLRIDYAGLGDSVLLEDGREAQPDLFLHSRAADLAAAIDQLQSLGYRQFATNGFGTGGYHAVQTALAEPRISTVIAINPPWLSLRPNQPGEMESAERGMTMLALRGAQVLLIFGADDPGLRNLECNFGPGCAGLEGKPGISVLVLPGIDHELSRGWMRQLAGRHVAEFILHEGEPA